MGSRRDVRAFLLSGAWVPGDVLAQLVQHLDVLQAWTTAHEPLEPSLALVINIQLADLEHLLDLGEHCGLLVSADRWRAALLEIELLTKWLTAHK